MVFYRKYRPQTIQELDNEEIRKKLYSVLSGSSVPHAFLFTGPKGLGKTSTARIVAKCLNCTGRKTENKNQKSEIRKIEPCNKCDQCTSITNGTNLDILEIDGASNRGIDEIRDLREKIKLSPVGAHKKVYIIDEVHMLTTEAFNALLKTLEEPPEHVVFVLCTTEPHKVPATILSRCLHMQFKKATGGELIRSFERIIKKESLEAEKEALRVIADFSDGSFRDGVKILEEMALLAKNKKITKELVERNYSVASTQYQIAQMIRFLEDRDVKGALGAIAKLENEGIEMEYFMQGLIEALHNSLLLKIGVENTSGSGLTLDNLKLEIPEIKKLINLLSEARSELKYAALPQLPLELVIIEWGIKPISERDESAPSFRGPAANFPPAAPLTSSIRAVGSPSSGVTPLAKKEVVNVSQQDMAKYDKNDAFWMAFLDGVKAYNYSIAGVLRGCSIKSYDNKVLLLEAKYKFHKDKLNEPKAKELLNKACRRVAKKDVKIEIVLRK